MFQGNIFSRKGSWMSFITDEIYFQFSAFSVLSRFSDSLCFTFINRPGSFNNNPQFKKLYLGDTNLIVKFDVSQPIFNQSYFYRIKTVWEKISGGRTELVESYMTDNLSEIENNNLNAGEFYLRQNYPNPFNPETVISYSLSENRFITLKVFDVLGNEIATLVNEKQNSGNYNYQFSTVNYQLASGIYFYKLEAGDFSETKRMILLK
ncbi:MAG: T9SS type A sorting domain-containing protein [Ignavibacteria bacterium]|nr:T9SS type A sorting domain-containing protein [Ignavibacteria bacterium]